MTMSSSTKVYEMNLYETPTGDDQIVYSTTQSRTCTLQATIGVKTAYFTLRDYTLTNLGTAVEIMVRHEGCIKSIDFGIEGHVLDTLNQTNNLRILYGVPNNSFGILVAKKYRTSKWGETVLVFHMLLVPSEVCVAGWHIWHDARKGRFMCEPIGPLQRSSLLEIMREFSNTRHPISSDGNQTSINGLINNLGAVIGDFNGSIINYIINIFLST
ncbi:unnamed protein product [Lathyrus sativus]|nr:unnamed protein product [Lathyrus sativus]